MLTDLLVSGVLDPADSVAIGSNGIYLVATSADDGATITDKVAALQRKADVLSHRIEHHVTPVLELTRAPHTAPVEIIDRTLVCIPAAVAHVLAQPSERIDEEDVPRMLNRVACLVGASSGARPASASPRQIERQNKQMKRFVQRKRLRVGLAIIMVPLVAVTAKVLISAPAPIAKAKANSTPASDSVAPVVVASAVESPTTATPIVLAPVVAFAPSCPVAGEGWVMAAVWPGTLANLQAYEYSVQNIFNGDWAVIGVFAPGSEAGVTLAKLPPGSTAVTRVVPRMSDGSSGSPIITNVVVPSQPC